MYYCKDCGSEFEKADLINHINQNKPLSQSKEEACPYCGSKKYYEKTTRHCKYCGALLPEGVFDYCNIDCRAMGKKLWEIEHRRRKLSRATPISVMIHEVDKYNKAHGTRYSYGQYVSLIGQKGDNNRDTGRKRN